MSIDQLFHLDPDSEHSLQKQIVEQIASAISGGHIPLDAPLPSSRNLSRQLKVGRNTVILAYERLVDAGYLVSRQRSGYFVNPDILSGTSAPPLDTLPGHGMNRPDWQHRFKLRSSALRTIKKPRDWQDYPYPFIYGQISNELFPLNSWRECSRDAVSARAVQRWSADRLDDDPLLIEQIHSRLLPRRGIWANADQIMITVGAQHALYMLFQLLLNSDSTIGLENPGYVDARNTAALSPARVKPLPINQQGLVVDGQLDECDCIYVTPSHQSPTTVTMPLANRYRLLEKAAAADILLIEDDYESELNYQSDPLPALKSLDSNDRVVYIGSMSKIIAPGLRVGYLVAPEPLIRELRALRRFMIRTPAANNQHALALFLSRGYHDSTVRKLLNCYRERHQVMLQALAQHLPQIRPGTAVGGSSFWLEGPAALDSIDLAERAAKAGIIIEPGDIFFSQSEPPRNCFRLGFSAVATDRIEPGIERLADVIRQLPA